MASPPSAASSFGATASAQAVAAPSADHVPSFRHGTTTHLPKAAGIPKKNSRDAYLLAGGLEQFLLDVVAEELAVVSGGAVSVSSATVSVSSAGAVSLESGSHVSGIVGASASIETVGMAEVSAGSMGLSVGRRLSMYSSETMAVPM